MDKEILFKLERLKASLKKEGFIIDGIFGSVARGEDNENSDIDILYHVNETFLNRYAGFIGFKKIEEVKEYLKEASKKDVDLAPIDNLSNTAKKYILKEVIYLKEH